ncbi:Translocation and assembly module TamA [Tepidimonas alkaliphilus]|uniref:Translocation and assembly module subunit TamA n=1 Tax=Tepidimonas alkaliphilus TaxID=2588942 RepID=A0A554WCW1_9BURK|nr:Translocation and assembly module TamA [Tepidimonas alkaliphilus]
MVDAPAPLDSWLRQHLDIQRFREEADLSPQELQRLADDAPADARRLLTTQGYFSPEVQAQLRPSASGPPELHLRVEPGPRTQVASIAVRVLGPDGAPDPALQAQARTAWSLTVGQPFTQAGWDDAKRAALAAVRRRAYPQAAWRHTLADIDPETAAAHLHAELASGPPVRWGEVRVEGAQRYPAQQALRWAQLAGLRAGELYDEAVLQAVQRHVSASPHYDAAFVRLDDDGDPAAYPVRLQVREAPRQQLTAALGYTSERGARLQLDHAHLRVPGVDAAARHSLLLSAPQRQLNSDWTGWLDARGWQWRGGLQLGWRDDGPARLATQQLRVAREQPGLTWQRSGFVQGDASRENRAHGPSQRARSLSAGITWVRRAFDALDDPEQGHGLAIEAAVGGTLVERRRPYARLKARWTQIWPTPTLSGRVVTSAEAGQVWAAREVAVPAGLRFLAGGDGSVRGYAPGSLGVPQPGGGVQPARRLWRASVEWQRPWALEGSAPGLWEGVWFVDVAAIGDRHATMRTFSGVGVGVRYRSPVGPVRVEAAYGVQARQVRLHVSVGFAF